MFEIIEGTKPKVKPNMERLWLVAFRNALIQNDVKKIVMAGTKYINVSRPTNDKTNMNQVQGRFDFINCIMMCMSKLTPKEFMQLFPINKTYDGAKSECKDYFSTMEFISTLEQDRPIGSSTALESFLWEYWNWDISMFMVELMSNMESMSHLKGQPGPMDKLIDDMGIDTYYKQEDEITGQEYMLNSATGKTVPVKEPIPRYLRLVQ